MQNDIERLQKLMERGRVAVVHVAAGRRREELVLGIRNQMASLRFSVPEEPAHFRAFVRGALNTIVDAACFESRYSGVVLLEVDWEHYMRSDMPMALLELFKLTTRMRLIILCGSESIAQHMAQCAAAFSVTGIYELGENPAIHALLDKTARRIGLSFESESALQQASTRYEEVSGSPAFNADTFLKSLADGRRISEASIRQESEDPFGYIRMCMKLNERGAKAPKSPHGGVERRIGFASSGEEEDMNERRI